MDFWSLQGVTSISSTIDEILKKKGCQIEEIFEDPHYLLELKSNERLIEFVLKEENIEKSIKYICDGESGKKGGMASETFSSEVEKIQEEIIKRKEIQEKLIETFIKEKDKRVLNNIVNILIALNKREEFKKEIGKKEKMINNLYDNLNESIKSNYLLLLIQTNTIENNNMNKFIEKIIEGKYIEEIEVILKEIMEWENSISQKMYEEFIKSDKIEEYFENIILNKGDKKKELIHILRIILPLKKENNIKQEKMIKGLEKVIENIEKDIKIKEEKIEEEIIDFEHIIEYCIEYEAEIIERKGEEIISKLLSIYLIKKNNSSIYRQYLNDIFTILIKKNKNLINNILKNYKLTEQLIENDKLLLKDHFKFDLYIFEYYLMIQLYSITKDDLSYNIFNDYILKEVLPRQENNTIYFKKPSTISSNNNQIKPFLIDEIDQLNSSLSINENPSSSSTNLFDFKNTSNFNDESSTFNFNSSSFGDTHPSNLVSSKPNFDESKNSFNFDSFSFDSTDFGDFN
ncbi:hypothetical protein, conserved [Entamoeba dispar SAW760]|uniref:Uncharacterized protein n=1 Tax=Entamoeba dispar (strain ATCC PRA-260 / SAW760) TaxID=370354 RepID=B0EF43_ENTDS|nr:uncharacterized protein EDI_085960 [Entamoeba dispar SAW760]EDR26892.1 hypothetical protein, conserved [Entamoeba dispar SAW760]|eukprot:EDR26892.1 hypothetical protein, conserved [Entamoeba dispar SAW760]